MRKIGFAKYLIGYTISDNDTREKFKEMLGKKIPGSVRVDQRIHVQVGQR